MLRSVLEFARIVAREPPFRLLTRLLVKALPFDIETKSRWDVVSRPHYLAGLVHAAHEAKAAGAEAFCAIELGVAGGNGLLALQRYAAAVQRRTGVRIDVIGFDAGSGLPEFCGDHRDHPDLWRPGDYPMNEPALRAQLSGTTRLVIGDVSETAKRFVEHEQRTPIGFVSFDLDLYSSTRDALRLFRLPGRNLLPRVTLYFDDTYTALYHNAAGEYLAIREFNAEQNGVFIDAWHNVKITRPFPEALWTNRMYIAHHLEAIAQHRRSGSARLDAPLVP